MAISPNTIVYLLTVPFESDYKNVVYWSSRASQTSTMQSKIRHRFTEFTYQRKDGIIRIPAHIDSIHGTNYVMYQNSDYYDKWFYAFIVKKEYVNDNVTNVYIETDIYNTYCFDTRVLECFVEREHTDNDTVGANTIPEDFELGEYICNGFHIDQKMTEGERICIESTVKADGTDSTGGMYGNVYSGTTKYAFQTAQFANDYLSSLDKEAKATAVNAVYMIPNWLVDGTVVNTGTATYDVSLPFTNTQVGTSYTPHNKKLLTFPYKYITVSNNQGGSAILHYEKFSSGLNMRVVGVPTPGCSIRCYPLSYNGVTDNYDAGLTLGKLPVCSWATDVYTNWLTQNSINLAVEGVSGLINTAKGMITGGASAGLLTGGAATIGGAVAGGVDGLLQIGSLVGKVYEHSLVPPQAKGNLNSGDVTFAMDKATFVYYAMTIKNEYAMIIDEFFTMYGYKTNRVKQPNTNHRESFWFTKTVNCDIEPTGSIALDADEAAIFKSIYDNGVTFWRNIETMGWYHISNNIIEV